MEVSLLLYLGERATNLHRHFVCTAKAVPMNMKARTECKLGGPEGLKSFPMVVVLSFLIRVTPQQRCKASVPS